MAPSNHRLNASQHQDLSRCSFTDALAVQGRPLRLPISHRPPSTQKRSRIDTARQQQFERPICRQDPSPDSGRSSALDHHYDGSSSVHEDRSDVSINDRASSSETGSHSSAVDVACADALDRLEKLSFQQMQSELDVHAEFIRASQQRAAIAARGEYLYKRIHGTLEDQRLRLEPRTFGWTEKPWVLGQASSRNWIGDTAYSPTGITESDLEAEIWSAMRHGEAASFPLESGRVSEEVFAGLLHAMVDDDLNALSQQWQARGVRRGAEEPKVSRDGGTRVEIREALRSGTRRITFNEVSTNRGVESRQEIDHDDSISENADTLFSASATPSGYGTPSHIRARSASPTMQSYNARGVPRVATMFRSPMPSRSQRRLEEDLRNAEARERAEISTKFRANPVPASSLVPR
ncbi:hypothetical protein HK101_009616 [Irineochytrium annulatum]|nr:hypothetical protein HK101_009616 [Irineochytrium annulatum]